MSTPATETPDPEQASNVRVLTRRPHPLPTGSDGGQTERIRHRLELLLETASEGSFDWNVETRELWATPRFHDIFDLDENRPIREAWLAAIHPDDLAAYLTAIRAHFGSERDRLDLQYRVQDKDGTCRWVLNRLLTIRRADGGVARVLGTVLDITGQKLQEERFARKSMLLDATFAHMDQGIVVIDENLTIVAFNDRLAELLDLPSEILAIGASLVAIFRYNAERGEYGEGDVKRLVAERVELALKFEPYTLERARPDGRVIEIRGNPLSEREGFVTTFTDITQRKRAERGLLALATTDELTGLNNRRQFFDLAEREMKRAARHGEPFSVLCLDIDRFKAINDRFGHAAGDEVLRAVASTIQKTVRGEDILGRIGGEEFAILLPSTSLAQATILAERIREAVGSLLVIRESMRSRTSVSIGLAEGDPRDPCLGDVIRHADEALYRAKRGGRDQVRTAAPRRSERDREARAARARLVQLSGWRPWRPRA